MNLVQSSGGQPQKQPKYTPIFFDRMFTGLYTQRNVLHDPSDIATARFYGGRPDALWDGANIELTNRLTLQRRPGLTQFSAAQYPTPPNRAFSFSLTDGSIRVIVDTGSTALLSFEAVDEISGVAFYVFPNPVPCAANNAYAGLKFLVTGFDNGVNNGTFTCTSSTANYLILNNTNAMTDNHFGTGVSSGAVYWDQQNGTIVELFAKLPGAGQSYFVGVAGVMYVGDGVDTWKYTPLNNNGVVANGITGFGSAWEWGTATPTKPPTVSIVESGNAAIQWAATTVFSTMGLTVDGDGNTQQLYSVNGLGNNPPPSTLGTSGNGAPMFNTTTGATTVDGSVTWTSQGPITLWQPNTIYTVGQPIYDPITNCIFVQTHSNPRQSGSIKPTFNATYGSRVADTAVSNDAAWLNIGQPNGIPSAVKTWAKNTHFNTFTTGNPPNQNAAITYPLVPNQANLSAFMAGTGPAIYLINATTGGTTANISYTPWTGIPAPPAVGSQSAGAVTQDNQLEWLCLGSSVRQPNTPVGAWSAQGMPFSCIQDPNGNMQVCTTTGTTSSAFTASIVWGTNYADVTQDGSATWTCVGPPVAWTANTQWNLPLVGFAPPGPSQPYGGSLVVGDGFTQATIISGLSGSSAPNWSVIVGHTTVDNFVLWETVAAYTQQSLSWTKGHVYAYSFEARLADDPFNTTVAQGGDGPPPGLSAVLGTPTGSETGLISTASPVFTITGANTGAVNTVSGLGSLDPQIDTIVIWRDADGGGPDNMFFLTEIPAPPPIAGVAQPWSFMDFLPDVATALYPGLNDLIPAPIDDENDPPPSTFLPQVYNFQRIWGSNGSNVPFSGGPDVITGNPNEAFNPADSFPYLAPVTRVVKNSQGLAVFLTDSVEFLGGGPLTSSFYSVTLSPGVGLLSYNALDVYAGEIYFLSADSQIKVLSPQLTLSTAGFPIGDKIAGFNSATAYLAVQQAGVDNAFYLADGATGWYRCNPRQVPGALSGPEPIWSPFAFITNGCKMVQSVEVAPGIKKLLVGSTLCNQPIFERNLNVFTDNGTEYDAFFVMGSIMLCHQGQIALLRHVAGDFSGVNFRPVMSYLLNEINTPQGTGVFTVMPNAFVVNDPPQIYGVGTGPYGTPVSYSPNRWYFSSTGSLARCRHLQLKVDYGKTSNGDEIFDLCIYGRYIVEL